MNVFNVILIEPLANGLALFYRILGSNMGLAIIGFSLALRLALEPLTRPYIESMKKMKEFAPQLEKLKLRHKDDKTKLMQAQAEFYKQKGINPGAGCLPMILQFVVLIALYNVFLKALSQDGNISHFNDLLYSALKFPEGYHLNTQFLYLDVVKPDVFHVPGVPFPLPGFIVILAAFSQMISAKITTPYLELQEKIAKKTPEKSDDMQAAIQSSAVYTFPLITLLAGVSLPAGLALYWLLFSVYQAYQQYRTAGWGGLTPWLKKMHLVKFTTTNGKK